MQAALFPRPIRWRHVLGLVLAPLLVAGAILWGTLTSVDRLHTVQAAIVNQDSGVDLNGQHMPLGRQLAVALVDGDRAQNISWVMADESHAASGLESGRYAAVVTIPSDFSKSATSWSANDATAHRATIAVATSPVGGIADTAVATLVANAASESFNTDLTARYLDNIYLGFNKTSEAFTSVKDGSAKLAEGSGKLSEGLGKLGSNGGTLADGVNKLANGTGELATNLRTMADRGTLLTTASGKVAEGTHGLAKGLGAMAEQTATMPSDVSKLASGVEGYVNGTKGLIDQLQTLGALSGNTTEAGNLTQATGGLVTGLESYQRRMANLAAGADPDTGQPMPCPADIQSQFGDAGCSGYAAGLKKAGTLGVQGLEGQSGKPGLIQAARNVDGGVSKLVDTLADLPKPSQEQMDKLPQLKAAGDQLIVGTRGLADNLPQLTGGIASVADGASKLAEGAGKLDEGVTAYTNGVGKVADNVQTMADGTAKLANGVRDYTGGVAKVADGAAKLDTGISKLADGLAANAGNLPNYDETEREALSQAASSPLDVQALGAFEVPSTAWASLLVVIGLWLGAMATFLMVRPIRDDLVFETLATPRLLLRALLPGTSIALTQALAFTLLTAGLLGLDVGQSASLFGVLGVAGVAFVTVNQALAAWFGNLGRFVAVALGATVAVGALTHAAPGMFDAIRGWTPLAPALDGVRATLTGGSTTGSVVLLVGWFVLGAAAIGAAVVRARRVNTPRALQVGYSTL